MYACERFYASYVRHSAQYGYMSMHVASTSGIRWCMGVAVEQIWLLFASEAPYTHVLVITTDKPIDHQKLYTMKTLYKPLLAVACFLLICGAAQAQSLKAPNASQKAMVMQTIGLTEITIEYSSPSVVDGQGRDRTGTIWGGLVPWNDENQQLPWRAGANENTVITFSTDVEVEGKALAAGSYGVHILTRENEPWTVIFSHNTSSWGSFFYRPEEDALRIEVSPEEAAFHKYLTYEFTDRDADKAEISLLWENLQLSFDVGVDVHAIALASFDDELRGVAAFSWQGWNQAANYCLSNTIELEKGLAYAERSIAGGFGAQPTFQNTSTKAMLLYRLDREEEAKASFAQAMEMGSVFELHQMGRQLIAMGEKELAVDTFEKNAELHPDTWPVNVGLARGYSAAGNYKKAIKHAELALAKAPNDLNRNNLKSMIEQLKNNQDIN